MRKKKATIISLVHRKGGTAKSTTCLNLGAGLALAGKSVALLDGDSQGSLTVSAGYDKETLHTSLSDLLYKVIDEEPIAYHEGILSHKEGFDLVPSNEELSGLEVALYNVMSRETVMKRYLEGLQYDYDYILIDCPPAKGLIVVNAMSCSDRIIIPSTAELLSVDLIQEVVDMAMLVKRNINPKLKIDGILPTIVDERTNFTKNILAMLQESCDKQLKIFPTAIPRGVKAAEATLAGRSIFGYAPKSKVAQAYRELTEQVLAQEKQRTRKTPEIGGNNEHCK